MIQGAATWPTQGEFAGQTEFITSQSASETLQFSAVDGQIDWAIGMTNGLEWLAINFENGDVNEKNISFGIKTAANITHANLNKANMPR